MPYGCTVQITEEGSVQDKLVEKVSVEVMSYLKLRTCPPPPLSIQSLKIAKQFLLSSLALHVKPAASKKLWKLTAVLGQRTSRFDANGDVALCFVGALDVTE